MNRAEFMSRLTALLQDVPLAEREEAIQYYSDYFDDAGEGNEASVIAALGSPEELAKSIKAGLVDGGNGGEFTESGFHSYEQRNKNQVMSTKQPQNDTQSGGNFQGGSYQGSAYGQQAGGYQGNPYGSQAGGAYGPQNGGAQAKSGGSQPAKSMSGGMIALIVILAILLSPVWIGILGGLFGIAVGLLAGLFGIFVALLVMGVVFPVVGVALVVTGIAAIFEAPLGGLCLVGGGLIMAALGLVFIWLMVLVAGTAIPALVRGIAGLCRKIFNRGGARA